MFPTIITGKWRKQVRLHIALCYLKIAARYALTSMQLVFAQEPTANLLRKPRARNKEKQNVYHKDIISLNVLNIFYIDKNYGI